MRATCYADASFSPRLGGAWGVWLRSSRGRIVRQGRCPPWVRDANLAELAAIYAGVYLAVSRWKGDLREILVCSDSLWALACAEPGAMRPRKKRARRLQRKLHALLEEHGVAVECRWVPGHRPVEQGTAAFLNAACDRMAKQARRRAGRRAR